MPFIIYSVLRLALIGVLGVVLYAVGVGGLLLPVLAIVLALMVSYLVLGKQREAAAVYLAGRKTTRDATGERFSRAVSDDAAFEDDQVDTVVRGPSAAARPTVVASTGGDQPTADAVREPDVEKRPDAAREQDALRKPEAKPEAPGMPDAPRMPDSPQERPLTSD